MFPFSVCDVVRKVGRWRGQGVPGVVASAQSLDSRPQVVIPYLLVLTCGSLLGFFDAATPPNNMTACRPGRVIPVRHLWRGCGFYDLDPILKAHSRHGFRRDVEVLSLLARVRRIAKRVELGHGVFPRAVGVADIRVVVLNRRPTSAAIVPSEYVCWR